VFALSLVGLLLTFSAIELGSQSGGATVVLTSVPAWGQDGNLTGSVYGVSSNQVQLYAFEFIPDQGWYQLGGCNSIPIQSTGQFSVNATPGIMGRYATRFSAYLIPPTLPVPCVQAGATIPFVIQQNALSLSTIPRIPQYSTLTFGGLQWFVKTAPVQVYAGPQFFVQQNAFLDSQGQLHLKITPCGGTWCAAEIFTTQAMGYGTYTFTINSPVNNLDPNVTLGLFPWDAQAGDQYNREWDIEFGRWGNATASANAQFVVQPYNGPNNIHKFLMSPAASSTLTVTWLPSNVQFVSTAGFSTVSQWTFNGNPLLVPTPGDGHLHLNLYVAVGRSPAQSIGQEVVIGNFQYVPSGPQIGFSRTSDSVPFLSSAYTVPITSTNSGCTATVESDSPWITVGSNPVPAGAALQYVVADNFGGPRTANLILQSTTCNASLGAQIMTISQSGLVCSPTFTTGSTHIGFLQTVRSVFIRGTAPVCSWSVTASSPWLHIVSAASGSGDGSIQFSADSNGDPTLRQGLLSMDNGQQHWVYQDASAGMLALSPVAANACGTQPPQFGASWIAPGSIQIRLGAPTGQLVGQFGQTGSTLLPQIGDGSLIFLVNSADGQPLASARASILAQNCNAPTVAANGVANGASFSRVSIAPGSFATVIGANLSGISAQANPPYPTTLGGITVSLSGVSCQLQFVSPRQVNFVVPAGLPAGRYLLTVNSATSDALITNTSPGIFTVKGDGTGAPSAQMVAVLGDGTTANLTPYQCDSSGCHIAAVSLPPNTASLYLILYGTGIKNANNISATLGTLAAQVAYCGAVPAFPGLDQVNLLVANPSGISGRQTVLVTTDGFTSNSVDLLFQ
jgi:uncharacterized protein (TIGR03437 family)